jgi:hypothetical protein
LEEVEKTLDDGETINASIVKASPDLFAEIKKGEGGEKLWKCRKNRRRECRTIR